MFRAFFMGVFCALFVLTATTPPSTFAQTVPNLRVLSQQTLPDSQNVKIADVGVAGQFVLITGNRREADAQVWRKTDTALTFGDPVRAGDAGDNSLFNNVAISTLPDGRAYVTWLGPGEEPAIFGRSIAADGSFGPTETIVRAGRDYRAYVDVAIVADGTTVVVWSESARFYYVYRSPATNNQWTSPNFVIDAPSLNIPQLTTGANNRIAIGFGLSVGDIYAGIWNGRAFDVQQVTGDNGYDADPTITLLPNGTPLVAWRRIDRGYFFAARQANGTWPSSRLSSVEVFGIASVSADSAGNVTYAWTGTDARLYVAYQTAQNVFDGPRVLAPGGSAYYNPRVATNVNNETLIHASVERFTGRNLNADYTLWAAQGAGTMRAKPVIDGDAALVGNKTSVSVSFTEVAGNPTQVRWRWGSPPTDTQSDSSGWVTFANPLNVPIPQTLSTGDCLPETLYTQVRSATTVESTIQADSITIDNQIAGALTLSNPFVASKSPVFTQLDGNELADLTGDGGASDGDPNYTREPFYYLEISGPNECSGLAQFQVGTSAQNLGRPFGIVDNFFANTLPFANPTDTTQGARSVFVRLQDKSGNQINFTRVLTYDTVKPLVADGAQLTITPNTRSTILADLQIANLQVTDSYPGNYWGFWIANSLTPISDPLSSTELNWTPVALSAAQRSASPVVLRNWSLATKLTTPARSIQPNATIYVYIRVLDGAGNPSDRVIRQQVTLNTVTLPQTWLPQVRR